MKVDQVLKIAEDTCGRIIFTDPDGNDLKILSFSIAMAPQKGGNAYFEMIKGDRISATVKERFKLLKPNDLIVVAKVEYIKYDGTKALMDGFNLSIVP